MLLNIPNKCWLTKSYGIRDESDSRRAWLLLVQTVRSMTDIRYAERDQHCSKFLASLPARTIDPFQVNGVGEG